MTTATADRITPELALWLRRQPPRVQHAVLSRLRQRPPPPPIDPPPPAGSYPLITEQVWKSSPYLALWGGWNVPQTAYGKEWGATGEGPGYLNGPILVDSYGQGMHVGKQLEHCRILGLGQHPTNKFGERIYNQINPVRRKCEYLGHLPEHYIYPGVLQGGLVEDVRFGQLGAKNACGSAWHWALRNGYDAGAKIDYSHETQQPELSQVESTRTFRRCEFLHIGQPFYSSGEVAPRFGAFGVEEVWAQLTIAGEAVDTVNTHIRFEMCRMVGGHLSFTDPNGVPVRSNRGFVVQGRPSLLMTDCAFDMPQPLSGWMGRVNGVQHVEIPSGEFLGGTIEVTDAKTVRIVGVQGTTKLLVKANNQTVYEGPLTGGYSKTK